jgi:hypothetical protein
MKSTEQVVPLSDEDVCSLLHRTLKKIFLLKPVTVQRGKNETRCWAIDNWVYLTRGTEDWRVSVLIPGKLTHRELPCIRRLDGTCSDHRTLWQALQQIIDHLAHLAGHFAIDEAAEEIGYGTYTNGLPCREKAFGPSAN